MSKEIRNYIIYCWVTFAFSCIGIYLYEPDFIKIALENIFAVSNSLGIFIFLFAGSLRSFTFLPITILIIAGFIFFTPTVLFFLIMTTVFTSSTIAYFFLEILHLQDSVSPSLVPKINWLKKLLTQYELPIIIFFSASPIFPTDILCYISGTLRINYWKFILGIIIGEGLTCAVYIFLGSEILTYLTKFF